MKKRLIALMLALVFLVITVYSAAALEVAEIPDQDVHVGILFSYDVELATDENVGDLTYELLLHPTGMEVSAEGKITWTPMLKHAGENIVRVNVSNGTHSDMEDFNLDVLFDAFTMSLNTASAPNSAVVEDEYKFKLVASSNYPLAVESYIYELVESPEGMILLNDDLIWTPTLDQFGSHTVKVSVLPKDAPSGLQPVVGTFNIDVQGMTIDRVEVRSDSRRLETVSRANYLSSSTPYVIDRESKLGDTIELKISIKNNLPSSNDNELTDVEIELYSFDLVNADGQEAFISRIRAGRTEDQTLSFFIDPLDIHPDDSPFDLEIRVSGETRDGDYFSDVWFLELKLESNSYDLLMMNPTLSPESICPDQRLRVSFDLRNIGTRDLSAAGVRYYVSGLDINEWDRNLNLDYDETISITKFLDIPADAVPGEYFLELTSYPRLSSSSDTRTDMFLINVRDCEPTTPTTPNITDPIIVTPPTQEIVVPGTPITDVVGTKSKSIFDKDNNLYVVLLTALVVLLLVGVILLLVSVFKK